MKELAVKKESIDVEVSLATGENLSGKIFVSPVAARHEGRETILDMMNDVEDFFVLIADNCAYIIHKAGVLEITVDIELEPPDMYFSEEIDTKRENVEIHFITGKSERGHLALLRDPYKSRLLDFMNIKEDFFVIKKKDKICIINKEQVEFVKTIKE